MISSCVVLFDTCFVYVCDISIFPKTQFIQFNASYTNVLPFTLTFGPQSSVGRSTPTDFIFKRCSCIRACYQRGGGVKVSPDPELHKYGNAFNEETTNSLLVRCEKCLWHFTAAFFSREFLETTWTGRVSGRSTAGRTPRYRSHRAFFKT